MSLQKTKRDDLYKLCNKYGVKKYSAKPKEHVIKLLNEIGITDVNNINEEEVLKKSEELYGKKKILKSDERILVSDEDKHLLTDNIWHIDKDGYARATFTDKTWHMHRYIYIKILGHELEKEDVIDHINSIRYDNRRENLRLTNRKENSRNKLKKAGTSSKYYGVTKDDRKKKNKYIVNVQINNNLTIYASYEKEEHAAYHYNLIVDEYNLSHAKKNEIEKPKDFVKYIKKEKANIELPKNIHLKINKRDGVKKYSVYYKHVYLGVFDSVEEAEEKLKTHKEKLEKERVEKIKSEPIKRNNNGYAIIDINKKECIVDEDDYYKLLLMGGMTCGKNNYCSIKIDGKQYRLHRFILGYEGKDFVDHINNNPLDNRKCNLRIVTPEENSRNRSANKEGSSKYIGVSWHSRDEKYTARITHGGKMHNLGYFKNEIDAAKARDAAALKFFGEHANLNFPLEQ